MRRPPYAPFRSGAPEFIVGLRPIEASLWLRPDIEADSLPAKRALLTERRAEVFREQAGSIAAQAEIAAMIDADLGGASPLDDPSPLVRASARVSDDLVVMMREGEGWRAAALTLCSPTFFSADYAGGKNLLALHAPVPDRLGPEASQGLASRIGRMFDMLREGLVLERFNWTVQAGGERFTPDGAPLRALAHTADVKDAQDILHLRVERQTIRLAPETGAVLFTIRISLDPLRAVLAEDGAKEAFDASWRGAPAHVRGYKKWDAYERLVQAALKA